MVPWSGKAATPKERVTLPNTISLCFMESC